MPSADAPRGAARGRAQHALRSEITTQALGVIAERGFDAVTADELAQAVGVSRRTLFRLFATKEDVVVAAYENLGDEALEALRERPADEAPWTSLHRALERAARTLARRPELYVEVHAVIARTPALRRRALEQRDGWRATFAAELGMRPRRPRDELACELRATAAIAAFDVATETWARSGGRRRLDRLLDEAFALLGAGLG